MTMDVIVASLPLKSFVICWMPNSFFLAEPWLHASLLCIRESNGPQDLTSVRKVQPLGNIAVNSLFITFISCSYTMVVYEGTWSPACTAGLWTMRSTQAYAR